MREWRVPVRAEELRVLVSGYQSWSEAELRPPTDVQACPAMAWRNDQGHDPVFLPSGVAQPHPDRPRAHFGNEKTVTDSLFIWWPVDGGEGGSWPGSTAYPPFQEESRNPVTIDGFGPSKRRNARRPSDCR